MKFTNPRINTRESKTLAEARTTPKTPPFFLHASPIKKLLAAITAFFMSGYCLAAPPPYQQISNANNIISIETEGFTDNVSQGGHIWPESFPIGHSGTSAMEATPNAGSVKNNNFESKSPRLDYRINFTTAGSYYIWVRALGATGRDDSLHVGLDGAASATSSNMSSFGQALDWSNTLKGGDAAMIDVAAVGEHTLNIWMREDGAVIDKLVLTTNSSYTPSGAGPTTSPQEEPVVTGNALPIDLRGSTPEQATINFQASKPADAQAANLMIGTFDADQADEGQLIINSNPPIPLFAEHANTANDDQNVLISISTPVDYWQDGNNTLGFHHIRTAGYSVDSIAIEFLSSPPEEPANTPPIINGTPATGATAGSSYLFQPTTSDEDGDALVCSILNQPPWADFDIATGALSGTPASYDQGTNSGIQISVSDGTSTTSLPAFSIVVADDTSAGAGSVVLNWSAPSTRQDGTPMSTSEIAGYSLHYGPSEGNYPDSIYIAGGNQTSASLDNRQLGETLYLVLTAWDSNGLESGHSNMAVVTIKSG